MCTTNVRSYLILEVSERQIMTHIPIFLSLELLSVSGKTFPALYVAFKQNIVTVPKLGPAIEGVKITFQFSIMRFHEIRRARVDRQAPDETDTREYGQLCTRVPGYHGTRYYRYLVPSMGYLTKA